MLKFYATKGKKKLVLHPQNPELLQKSRLFFPQSPMLAFSFRWQSEAVSIALILW